MVTGVIGLCGQYVINLVTVEKGQELECATTPPQSLAEMIAMENHWRQVYVMKQTAKVHYHCSKYCRSILIDQHTHIYIYIYVLYIYIY